jgi:hypothetical protein
MRNSLKEEWGWSIHGTSFRSLSIMSPILLNSAKRCTAYENERHRVVWACD